MYLSLSLAHLLGRSLAFSRSLSRAHAAWRGGTRKRSFGSQVATCWHIKQAASTCVFAIWVSDPQRLPGTLLGGVGVVSAHMCTHFHVHICRHWIISYPRRRQRPCAITTFDHHFCCPRGLQMRLVIYQVNDGWLWDAGMGAAGTTGNRQSALCLIGKCAQSTPPSAHTTRANLPKSLDVFRAMLQLRSSFVFFHLSFGFVSNVRIAISCRSTAARAGQRVPRPVTRLHSSQCVIAARKCCTQGSARHAACSRSETAEPTKGR